MKNTSTPENLCPFKKEACPLAQEVISLRKEIGHLRKLVRVDALTEFYNFRHFREALTTEMERTRRTGLPTGLIMADLDHFKSINDTYGHEAGNLALANAASLWHNQIRQLDIPCRYGGEEFAIIMPGTRFPMAVRAAKRLRAVLVAEPFEMNGDKISVTASFGVDCFQVNETISLDEFVRRTDDYLLQAKQSGRNRVCYDEDRMNDRSTEISDDERKLLYVRPDMKSRHQQTDKRLPESKDKGPTQHAE